MARDDLALAVERHCTSKLDRRPRRHPLARLPRRGAGRDRRGGAADDRLAPRRRPRGGVDRRRWRPGRRGRPGGAVGRNPDRGPRPLLRDPGPAQVPEVGAGRGERRSPTWSSGWRLPIPKSASRCRAATACRSNSRPQSGAEARRERLAAVLGRDFRDNAIEIDAAREGARLTGFAGLPTYSRANSLGQFLFVNGRPVRDKLLLGALRAAYADLMKRDRHPVAALFIDDRSASRSTSTSTRPRPMSVSATRASSAA